MRSGLFGGYFLELIYFEKQNIMTEDDMKPNKPILNKLLKNFFEATVEKSSGKLVRYNKRNVIRTINKMHIKQKESIFPLIFQLPE